MTDTRGRGRPSGRRRWGHAGDDYLNGDAQPQYERLGDRLGLVLHHTATECAEGVTGAAHVGSLRQAQLWPTGDVFTSQHISHMTKMVQRPTARITASGKAKRCTAWRTFAFTKPNDMAAIASRSASRRHATSAIHIVSKYCNYN